MYGENQGEQDIAGSDSNSWAGAPQTNGMNGTSSSVAAAAAANSNSSEWAQYYQYLESYHNQQVQHQTQQAAPQVDQYYMYANSARAPAEYSSDEYNAYAQWYYQNYGQHSEAQRPEGSIQPPFSQNQPNNPPSFPQPQYSEAHGFQFSLAGNATATSSNEYPYATQNQVLASGSLPHDNTYTYNMGGYPGREIAIEHAVTAPTTSISTDTNDHLDTYLNGSLSNQKPLYSSIKIPKKNKNKNKNKNNSIDNQYSPPKNMQKPHINNEQLETAYEAPPLTPSLATDMGYNSLDTHPPHPLNILAKGAAMKIKGGSKYQAKMETKMKIPTSNKNTISKDPEDTEWPDSLKNFVQRSYASASASARHKLEVQLKQIISSAIQNKKLHIIDWDNRSLPKACDIIATSAETQTKNSLKRTLSNMDFNGGVASFDSAEKKERRLRRFQREKEAANSSHESSSCASSPRSTPNSKDPIDLDNYTIVGTNTTLEKSYLRLTSAPDPATVRPLHILRKTLDLIKRRWIDDANYTYVCDQFKSLRQDLTVQRITNSFTVEVYEMHARIALETNDLGEYNQCQTQLKQLYSTGLPGNPLEFLAYRILYFLYTRNTSDINAALAAMTVEERKNSAVRHALDVRVAITSGNYHRLFKLYKSAPNMGGYLMDNFIDRERCTALRVMCKAYRPKLSTSFISEELAFEKNADFIKFLKSISMDSFCGNDGLMDMKAAFPYAMAAMQKFEKVDIKGQIY